MTLTYDWRGDVESSEVNALHADAFGHRVFEDADWDWKRLLAAHSLGWVCARQGDELVGFVNVVWDGSVHAFLIDTIVATSVQRHGVGTRLVSVAVAEARSAGCEWLHVDFEDHLMPFYVEGCGFEPSNAGLIEL